MPSVEGVTVHGGERSTVRLHRDAGPVRFRRGAATIPADPDHVVDTRRSTTLAADGARVGQVEHLLAALALRGHWHGVVVEVSADALPILDGSAREWLALVDALPAPAAAPAPLRPAHPVRVRDGEAWAEVVPGPRRLCCTIAFDHPAIGEQRWCGDADHFEALADARTFGFLRDLEALRALGLAGGASLENAIVFDDEGPLRPLRSPDEPVRHKALDALGDLALLGRPLHGTIRVHRGSHGLHLALMRELRAPPQRSGRPA